MRELHSQQAVQKVIALAVSGEKRSPAFPDVPTMKELGYPDLVSYSWFGISVPADPEAKP